jgi:DNA damage-inducible protein 1
MLALHVRDMVGNTGLPQANRAPPAAIRQPAARSPAGGPIEQDPEVIRLRILGNPNLRQQFLRQQPDFADAIESPQRFAQAWRRNQDREREEQNSRARQIANLNADPFDIEAQTKIAEIIREAQVQENLQNAIEHNPEGSNPSLHNRSYPANPRM